MKPSYCRNVFIEGLLRVPWQLVTMLNRVVSLLTCDVVPGFSWILILSLSTLIMWRVVLLIFVVRVGCTVLSLVANLCSWEWVLLWTVGFGLHMVLSKSMILIGLILVIVRRNVRRKLGLLLLDDLMSLWVSVLSSVRLDGFTCYRGLASRCISVLPLVALRICSRSSILMILGRRNIEFSEVVVAGTLVLCNVRFITCMQLPAS